MLQRYAQVSLGTPLSRLLGSKVRKLSFFTFWPFIWWKWLTFRLRISFFSLNTIGARLCEDFNHIGIANFIWTLQGEYKYLKFNRGKSFHLPNTRFDLNTLKLHVGLTVLLKCWQLLDVFWFNTETVRVRLNFLVRSSAHQRKWGFRYVSYKNRMINKEFSADKTNLDCKECLFRVETWIGTVGISYAVSHWSNGCVTLVFFSPAPSVVATATARWTKCSSGQRSISRVVHSERPSLLTDGTFVDTPNLVWFNVPKPRVMREWI